MLPLLAPTPPAPSGGQAPASAPERIRAARPDLPPDGSTFRAAVLLLTLPRTGVNVDRLAARTRFPRPWVAACVRRLVDAGVATGAEEPARWSPDDFRFWNEVAVAEGRLLRRTDDRGRVEWAPPGAWHKAFDYVREEDPGAGVTYVDACPPPEDPEAAAPEAPRPPAEAPRPRLAVPREPPRPVLAVGAPRRGELFPEAAWLS